jgi:DNA-binding LacI/PurR family transcriptional regulator
VPPVSSPQKNGSQSRRVQLRDIADRLGLHVSTVCRALKPRSTISEKTQARVLAAAQELGYRPDPMLTALSHYRRRQHPEKFHATLGWLTNHEKRDGWRLLRFPRLYWEGASARAAELGYRLEIFWMREPHLRSVRLAEMLRARGIPGLIFAPQPVAGSTVDFPCEGFSCVTIGQTLSEPHLHRVGANYHQVARQAYLHLAELGYRRIGLVCNLVSAHRTLYAQEALAHTLAAYGAAGAIPPFALRTDRLIPEDIRSFNEWWAAHQPEALISVDDTWPGLIRCLNERGLKFPADYGLISLSRPDEQWKNISWVDQNDRQIGAEAVELLAILINRGETGLPRVPIQFLLEGQVRERGSLRNVGPPNHELIDLLR